MLITEKTCGIKRIENSDIIVTDKEGAETRISCENKPTRLNIAKKYLILKKNPVLVQYDENNNIISIEEVVEDFLLPSVNKELILSKDLILKDFKTLTLFRKSYNETHEKELSKSNLYYYLSNNVNIKCPYFDFFSPYLIENTNITKLKNFKLSKQKIITDYGSISKFSKLNNLSVAVVSYYLKDDIYIKENHKYYNKFLKYLTES